ncbi:MAG TPA: hypothetical protein DCZ74_08785, partial [Treponema sp.]|nr:hypothetical protein [Treponema sp.]
MKKLYAFLAILFASVSLYAASSSAVSGSARIASEQELPQGLFVYASGYLPGDSISLTNSDSGLTVVALNMGQNPDGSHIMIISSQVANRLGIKENSTLYVRLGARQVSFDVSVSGTARITAIPVETPEESIKEDDNEGPGPEKEPEEEPGYETVNDFLPVEEEKEPEEETEEEPVEDFPPAEEEKEPAVVEPPVEEEKEPEE